MKVNLTNGLIQIIEAVEQLPQSAEFVMGNYALCVIGQTIGWSKDHWGDISEDRTLRRIFGIKKTISEFGGGLFSDDSYNLYTERTWNVIKLFTSNIGPYRTRDEWLTQAYEVLSNLK